MSAAWAYHTATNHSLASLRSGGHGLDWPNQPLPYKIYTSLPPVPLAREPTATKDGRLDLAALARLCRFSNGIMRVIRRPDGDMPFRAAACTGALYHIELYLVCQDLPGLGAGVYHYGAHDHALRQLRAGDFRRSLVEATGQHPRLADAPAVLICTSTFWRNAWKYQARAYRHSFWDSGTVLANLLALCAASAVDAAVLVGFADQTVNALLDVEPTREAALCLVPLGAHSTPPPVAPQIGRLDYPTQRLSPTEIAYPAIEAVHAASSLPSGDAVAAWRSEVSAPPLRPLPGAPIEQVIARRGSARQFARTPIARAQLELVLDASSAPLPVDFAGPLTMPYVIVNAVDGLAPGAYVYEHGALELLRPGDVRDIAGFLDLGQELAADAAVNIYSLANLHHVLEQLGERGYRAAQLEGAIAGGQQYLTAYAQSLGATGLTFFDDDVTRFFSPHAADKSVLFLTAIGHPARRR